MAKDKPSPRNPPEGKKGAESRDYKIGKGRPPLEHQWKPHQSGNSKGRKKGSKNRKTIVRMAEHKTFSVKKAGRPRKMTATEIGLHNLQQDILRGDRKAFLDYLEIVERYSDRGDATASMQDLLSEDQAIIANMLARKTRAKTPTSEE
jgi:hypothetical protein